MQLPSPPERVQGGFFVPALPACTFRLLDVNVLTDTVGVCHFGEVDYETS